MYRFITCLALLTLAATVMAADKPRLIVTTDIGGDPDDQQSLVRLLVMSNQFDIEGLIASASGTPGELDDAKVSPQLIHEQVDAYAQIRGNLTQHASGFPTASYLRSVIKSGNKSRGTGAVGSGHDTEGSNWIIAVVDRSDARPVNVAIWGGQTDLAQALWTVKSSRSSSAYHSFVSKIRVHDIADQDGIFPFIRSNHPDLWYVLDNRQSGGSCESVFRGMFRGGDTSLVTKSWIDTKVKQGHGPLGALYPKDGLWTCNNGINGVKEGDTPSYFYFLDNGLQDASQPGWGGWGGRFQWEGGHWQDAKDSVGGETSRIATVWRWRQAYQNDFEARMDWCVKSYGAANHHPVAKLNGSGGIGIVRINATAGDRVDLSASGSSDPDNDGLSYKWWQYQEADSYGGSISISGASSRDASFTAPNVSDQRTIHVVLEVTDTGSPRLTSYRRAIVTVSPDTGDDDPDPSVITGPATGTVLSPGQSVTATGTGDNLSWEADLITDGQGAFASGSGSSFGFTVPVGATSDQTIVLTLRGDGGTATRAFAIAADDDDVDCGCSGADVADDFNDGTIDGRWTRIGDRPLSETGGAIAVQTANGSSTWLGGGLFLTQPVAVNDGLTWRVRLSLSDLSANEFAGVTLTPQLAPDSEGQSPEFLRVSFRAGGIELRRRQSGVWSTLWSGGSYGAGQWVEVELRVTTDEVVLLLDGTQRFSGSHGMGLVSVHPGFRAANRNDGSGGTTRFDFAALELSDAGSDPEPAPTVITGPVSGTTFAPGETVTVTGSGDALVWGIDRINDGVGDFASGTGSSFSFTVPADSTEAQFIRVKLSGDGGDAQREFDIELPTNPDPDPTYAPIGLGTTEAETLDRSTFYLESYGNASGGAWARLPGSRSGSLTGSFVGPDGTYDLTVRYRDEFDGASSFSLTINGSTVDSWVANDVSGSTSDVDRFVDRRISGLALDAGDTIVVSASSDRGEYARVDLLTVTAGGASDIAAEVAYDPTDANGWDMGKLHVWNHADGVAIVRVELSLSSGVIDYVNGSGATIAPGLGGNNDGVHHGEVDLNWDSGLAAGASSHADADIDGDMGTISVRVVFADGRSLSGTLVDVGDSDDGDPRYLVFDSAVAGLFSDG